MHEVGVPWHHYMYDGTQHGDVNVGDAEDQRGDGDGVYTADDFVHADEEAVDAAHVAW